MGKRSSNTFGDILKGMVYSFFGFFKGLFRLFLKVIVTCGLYLPITYAVFGLILYLACDFNPFDFGTYSLIYLSGGLACVVCAFIITVRNIIVRPVKSAIADRHEVKSKRYEEWADVDYASEQQQKNEKALKEELNLAPPVDDEYDSHSQKNEEDKKLPPYLIDEDDFSIEGDEDRNEASMLLFDWLPRKKQPNEKASVKSKPKKEIPEIYYSKLQPNILVHEYEDRFELFRVVGDKTVSVGVEYK